VLTGCFYDTVDNLLIDPDAQSLHDAKYIIQQCVQPTWEIERQFGLPTDAQGQGLARDRGRQGPQSWRIPGRQSIAARARALTWGPITKSGPRGRRWTPGWPARMDENLSRAFDQVIGDYAYIVVMPGVPFPLNARAKLVRSATDSEVQKRFRWPVPYWLDDRWPVTCWISTGTPTASGRSPRWRRAWANWPT
jgi:hypothetical protein